MQQKTFITIRKSLKYFWLMIYEADLWFYKTKDVHEADSRDEIWYFSDDEYSATAMICWVEDKYDADVWVYQVRDKYEARWNKGNKFLGRIG